MSASLWFSLKFLLTCLGVEMDLDLPLIPHSKHLAVSAWKTTFSHTYLQIMNMPLFCDRYYLFNWWSFIAFSVLSFSILEFVVLRWAHFDIWKNLFRLSSYIAVHNNFYNSSFEILWLYKESFQTFGQFYLESLKQSQINWTK